MNMETDTTQIVWAETTIVGKGGRTSIPKKMRDLLKVCPGDYIQWIVLKDGSFLVKNVHKPEVKNPKPTLP